ncbi:MAG: hypothetical protein NVS4B12_09180 [Ktedonobacteraceae bacterium]
MEIEGTYTLQATPKEVWQLLADQQTLLDALPEIEKLERIDDYTHSLALHLPYTPLQGTYYGLVRVAESHRPNHSRLIIESVRDTQNTMSSEAIVDLQSYENTTVVTYEGDIQLHKAGTQLQQTVIKGAAKLLIQQFFTALEEQLWQQTAKKRVAIDEEIITITAVQRPSSQPRTGRKKARPVPFLQRLIHLFRLGKGNLADEERWTQRIHRSAYASMLIFLVWVGTRIIPRR